MCDGVVSGLSVAVGQVSKSEDELDDDDGGGGGGHCVGGGSVELKQVKLPPLR